jgi:hypothetical protein
VFLPWAQFCEPGQTQPFTRLTSFPYLQVGVFRNKIGIDGKKRENQFLEVFLVVVFALRKGGKRRTKSGARSVSAVCSPHKEHQPPNVYPNMREGMPLLSFASFYGAVVSS